MKADAHNEEALIQPPLEEIIETIVRMKRGKAPGYDGITTSIHGNRKENLYYIEYSMWNTKIILLALIVPIHKKGDAKTIE